VRARFCDSPTGRSGISVSRPGAATGKSWQYQLAVSHPHDSNKTSLPAARPESRPRVCGSPHSKHTPRPAASQRSVAPAWGPWLGRQSPSLGLARSWRSSLLCSPLLCCAVETDDTAQQRKRGHSWDDSTADCGLIYKNGDGAHGLLLITVSPDHQPGRHRLRRSAPSTIAFFIAAIGQSPCIALPCHTWENPRPLANGRPRAAVALEGRANSRRPQTVFPGNCHPMLTLTGTQTLTTSIFAAPAPETSICLWVTTLPAYALHYGVASYAVALAVPNPMATALC